MSEIDKVGGTAVDRRGTKNRRRADRFITCPRREILYVGKHAIDAGLASGQNGVTVIRRPREASSHLEKNGVKADPSLGESADLYRVAVVELGGKQDWEVRAFLEQAISYRWTVIGVSKCPKLMEVLESFDCPYIASPRYLKGLIRFLSA